MADENKQLLAVRANNADKVTLKEIYEIRENTTLT